ncbi:ShlB/FhaC/HecB family hemolysin secretion/activation protein [Salmonella enterica subsp. enterica]|uniref:ShlB/FhaC/HecB family hemolysin secretion/activation protein n=1 Tax=Salmonella enterica TaxID=28901 RepID=A0A5U4D445_SALER|nr:ShlB/FhaC/HecB family hemolysin secretion/activation protein [Salmonella enterica subsp. enterica]EBP8539765.1 ShlB/FhaC/HecB family hemolysin secretion/activation protein [Salmonella enterica]EBT4152065.1 ShlB/FhaC/HecB family hemolysin secretion/activation protein [Salmonella enterica subsp. enterica]EED9463101.1 ShlB/FhaC/HecB family hemolysin secretion/activation protein [Salmonella enterica subsp. enterica serovar Abaetetuba]
MQRRYKSRNAKVVMLSVIFSLPAEATVSQPELHQQAQQKALQEQLVPEVPDIRLIPPETVEKKSPVSSEDSPCFNITHIDIQGRENFPHWVPFSSFTQQALNRCLGVDGISHLAGRIQERLAYYGWVITRVLVPEQNLNQGKLRLKIVPGRTGHIRLSAGSDNYIQLWNAMPVRDGQLLDLRQLEQGMENLQRPPTVDAEVSIVPGESPGESDIVITRHQSRLWRIGLDMDDSGQQETGRYQGTATLWLDNPLSLSDTFFISGTHDLKFAGRKNSQSLSAYYAIPFGYWLWSITASESDYTQTVAGFDADTRYRGRQNNLDMQLSRVLYRNESQKNTLSYDVLTRESRQYINDTETDVQRTTTSAWRIGLTHRHYIGNATLDTGIHWQRGTRWFGAQPVPGEEYGEATGLSKILTWNASLTVPFALSGQQFRFSTQYLRQTSSTPLISTEQFSVGNRWTVRGFDGERTLNADNGGYSRNELVWLTPVPQQELYLGVDYGSVSGHGAEYLPGRHLAGGVVGLRGSISRASLSYDVFTGRPLSKPDGFKTSRMSSGFSISWQY